MKNTHTARYQPGQGVFTTYVPENCSSDTLTHLSGHKNRILIKVARVSKPSIPFPLHFVFIYMQFGNLTPFNI